MTAYVDFRFTEAEGWTNSANAISDSVSGAATATATSGTDTPLLTLSAPVITFASDGTTPTVEGVQWELTLSRGGTGSGAQIDYARMFCAVGAGTIYGSGEAFGEFETIYAPVEKLTFGGAADLNGFPSLTYDQFSKDLTFGIQGVNAGSKSQTFQVWDVKGRVYLDTTSMEDIAKRAFRKINVLSIDEELDADSLAHGIDLLNDMMFGWDIFGVDVGHIERASGEAFPLARKFVEGTSAQLAERLSPDYQVPAPSADAFFRQLQAEYLTIAAAEIPTTLRKTSSQRRWYES